MRVRLLARLVVALALTPVTSALARGGWKRDTLKIGDKVTVTGAAAAKDGTNAGGSMPTTSMTLADGQKLVMR